MKHRVVLCAALLAACGTLSTLEPDADSVTVKDVVNLQPVGDPLAIVARPDTFVTLVAHIPSKSTVRTVAFTSSAGAFILTGTKDASVRAVVDTLDAGQRLAAYIEVRRTDTSAYTIVSATVAGYRDTVRVRFR